MDTEVLVFIVGALVGTMALVGVMSDRPNKH